MNINPMSKIITMGDFNDNPDDPSIKIALKTESEIEKVTSSVLYNPMEVLYTKKYYWTNYYQGAGYMLDQLIVSGSLLDDNSKLKYLKAGVFNKRWLINGKDKGRWRGYPTKSMVYNRFDPKGYSDHLPVFLYLASEIN